VQVLSQSKSATSCTCGFVVTTINLIFSACLFSILIPVHISETNVYDFHRVAISSIDPLRLLHRLLRNKSSQRAFGEKLLPSLRNPSHSSIALIHLIAMGYHEIPCQLCGTSFNIGRIRTHDEPRTSAWTVIAIEVFEGDQC
jgi:hypothetical protein